MMFIAQLGFILVTSFLCGWFTHKSASLILGELFCFIPAQISFWIVFGQKNAQLAKQVLQKIIISELTKLCLIIFFFVLAFKWSNLLQIYQLFLGFVLAQIFQIILPVIFIRDLK